MIDTAKLAETILELPSTSGEVPIKCYTPLAKANNETTTGHLKRDGRTAQKTHRTLAFATRVTPIFDHDIRAIAENEGLKLVEVLEKAIEVYKEKQGY
ncbi:hypothetical protein [Buttiauxella noackiae]|uniref:hypothetical protein n=1 Tax=Buttiauxella noackiae TaxID=82992 RepID=UPI000AE87156|nr:hypothetical protein [Buttiauxella noackiae]